MTYPYLVATSYEMSPHRGGMADATPWDDYWPRDRIGYPILDVTEPVFVCDSWLTRDRTIVDDELPGWDYAAEMFT